MGIVIEGMYNKGKVKDLLKEVYNVDTIEEFHHTNKLADVSTSLVQKESILNQYLEGLRDIGYVNTSHTKNVINSLLKETDLLHDMVIVKDDYLLNAYLFTNKLITFMRIEVGNEPYATDEMTAYFDFETKTNKCLHPLEQIKIMHETLGYWVLVLKDFNSVAKVDNRSA